MNIQIDVARLSEESLRQSASPKFQNRYSSDKKIEEHKSYVPKAANLADQSHSSIRSHDDSLSVIKKIKMRKQQQFYEDNWA